jgi:hypothetical protein
MVDVVAALGASDCEGLRSGWLAQPANAVSSFAYVVAGALLLWRSRRPSVESGVLLTGAAGMIGVGIGSIAYHGPQPGWARLAHEGSVVALVLLFAGYVVRQVALVGGRRGFVEMVVAWKYAAAWMVPALVAYFAGRTGSPWCHPDTLWQPHAAWHGLSAMSLSLAMLGCSIRRDRRLDQRTSRTPSMPAERWPGREQ